MPRSWPGLRRLDLARLDDDAAAGLALDCAGAPLPDDVVAAVLGAAAGLPLLVEELLAGLVERGALRLTADGWQRTGELVLEVPAGLTELVADRLDQLAAPGRDVLCLAAVAGDDVEHRLLAEVLGVDETAVLGALRAGVAANLLTADGPRLTWRHALTRDAVLATLLPPERAALAARLAEQLDQRSDADAAARGGAAVGRGRPGGPRRPGPARAGPRGRRPGRPGVGRGPGPPGRATSAGQPRWPRTWSGCSPCRAGWPRPGRSAPRCSTPWPGRRTPPSG